MYFADNFNNRVRKVTIATGVISTIAGSTSSGFSGDGSAATSAGLNYPDGIALDSSGNVYIGDSINNRVRKVTVATNVITTVAGCTSTGFTSDGVAATSSGLWYPSGLAIDSSGIIVFVFM